MLELDDSCKTLTGVLFDLDDTMSDESSVSFETFSALNELAVSGLQLLLCTGRPASWAEALCKIWPIHGAIAENGAIGFLKQGNRVIRYDWAGSLRVERRKRLEALVEAACLQIPSLRLADDAPGRISDINFDIGEFHHAQEAEIQSLISLARSTGARTTRSSVHLHLTFDREDKATGALRLLKELPMMNQLDGTIVNEPSSFDQTRARYQWAYIGDSENDAPCFAAFSHSIGVSNLKGDFSILPKYMTRKPRGDGFQEFAYTLLQMRKNSP